MRPFVNDTYTPLNRWPDLGDGTTRPPAAQTWVDDVDARRLAAYRLLAAYRNNAARYYLPDTLWQRPEIVTGDGKSIERDLAPAEKLREYGDPALLVDQARSLLLGEEQRVHVPDAAPLPDDATEEQQATQAFAQLFLDRLDEWADVEDLWLKLVEEEENAVGDGDGVLVLGWDDVRQRPRLRVYDPGFYFPDLTGDDDDDYPAVVHVAWEWEDKTRNRAMLRRLTWRLVDLPAGESRTYAWTPEGATATQTVLFSEGDWDLGRLRGSDDVYQLNPNAAEWREVRLRDGSVQVQHDVDLRLDFLPVVHVPNDAAGARHFGRSLLLRVAGILDDLANADTDLAASSAVVGNTPLVTTGGGPGNLPMGPGARLDMPPGGDAKFLDTSRNLTAQTGYVEQLLDRLSVNTRLAAALLGRVKPNEVPSGYALELGFAATRSLIREMRGVRAGKFALLLKMAARMYQAADLLPAGVTPRCEVAFGPYLPADKASAVDLVKALLPVHGISVHTAVLILQSAGLPVEDAQDEVARIRAEWAEAALQIFEATGNSAEAASWLGITLPTPPPVNLPTPPAGGSGG